MSNIEIEIGRLVVQMHSSGVNYEAAMDLFESAFISEVLKANGGNQCKASVEMGVHRNTLSRRMAAQRHKVVWTLNRGILRPPETLGRLNQALVNERIKQELQCVSLERDPELRWEERAS